MHEHCEHQSRLVLAIRIYEVKGGNMKTNRQLEIIYLLLKKRNRPSEELARHFGVSVKTIYRDVDSLAAAGVPIIKQQGVNGGIILSEDYLINKSKLTKSEEAVLINALDDIKKLPNAQLEYALKLMKQYFNEVATLWVSTDDVSLDIQDKFHRVKIAIIEKRVISCRYYFDGEFLEYMIEPYELRIKKDIWKVLVRDIKGKDFREIYISRMTDIEIKKKGFTRRPIPDVFGKRYGGETEEVVVEVPELTEELLNRYPIESFDFGPDTAWLKIRVRPEDEAQTREQISKLLK